MKKLYNSETSVQNKNGRLSINLSYLMKLHGLDDRRLAKLTDIAHNNIARMRLNPEANPTASTLIPIARAFGITVGQLIGEEKLPDSILAPVLFAQNEHVAQVAPVITWQQIDSWINKIQNKYANYVSIPSTASLETFCIKIDSKSYGLIIRDGSIVVIDPLKKIGSSGSVLIKRNNEFQFVNIITDNDGMFFRPLDIKMVEPIKFDSTHKILGAIIEIRYIID